MAEIIRNTTEYPTNRHQNYSRPFDASISSESEQIFVLKKTHVAVFILTIAVLIGLIGLNLFIQQKTAQADIAVRNYESNISELQAQTDTIYNKISDQYNYQVIKEAAKNGNMRIDSSRVRSVK